MAKDNYNKGRKHYYNGGDLDELYEKFGHDDEEAFNGYDDAKNGTHRLVGVLEGPAKCAPF
jgi:hypothetical protein